MRISDWSSDVCSSDLLHVPAHAHGAVQAGRRCPARVRRSIRRCLPALCLNESLSGTPPHIAFGAGSASKIMCAGRLSPISIYLHPVRSEEHTSELQSLMRISYAVFCLTTKK